MKTLIVNADDYGRTADISRGIRHSHLNGIVSTTTTMMGYGTAQDDIKTALEQCPKLGLGVHLTLTSGNPVLPGAQLPTLTRPDGSFFTLNQLGENFASVNPDELKAEWRAQIEKFLATGAAIDHIDSHHHTSYYTEVGFGIMLDLANEFGAPVRRPRALGSEASDRLEFTEKVLSQKGTWCPQNFVVTFYDEGATLDHLISLINSVPDERVTEIMSHPGYIDDDIMSTSSYNRQRETELAVITDLRAREAIDANGITLATFRSAK